MTLGDDLVVVDRHGDSGRQQDEPVMRYYSAAHADPAVTTDVDGSAIGFGVPGSTAANEQIAEATAGLIHDFFRDPKIGGIQFMAQHLTCGARPSPYRLARRQTRP